MVTLIDQNAKEVGFEPTMVVLKTTVLPLDYSLLKKRFYKKTAPLCSIKYKRN